MPFFGESIMSGDTKVDDPDRDRLEKVFETPLVAKTIKAIKKDISNRSIDWHSMLDTMGDNKERWLEDNSIYKYRNGIGSAYKDILQRGTGSDIELTRIAFRKFMENLEAKKLWKWGIDILKQEYNWSDNFLGGSIEYPDVQKMVDKAKKRREEIKVVIEKYYKLLNPKWKPDKVTKKMKKLLKIKFQPGFASYDPLPMHLISFVHYDNRIKF